MAERLYWFLLAVLGTWRLTHLLSTEAGPRNCFARLRLVVSSHFGANLLDCFYCLSVWVSAPLAIWIGAGAKERILLWLAISAAAILLERSSTPQEASSPAQYFEHIPGEDHVMLRKQ
jgi:hypothetical protein